MNPKAETLDRFGREVVVGARDRGIAWFDGMLSNAPRPIPDEVAPEVIAMMADANALAELPSPIQKLVRRTVVLAINATVHEFLVRLSDESREGKGSLVLDGVDLFKAAWDDSYWPGLEGGLYTEDGWYARYSPYGEYGDPAKP
jgi:hypothetical protein